MNKQLYNSSISKFLMFEFISYLQSLETIIITVQNVIKKTALKVIAFKLRMCYDHQSSSLFTMNDFLISTIKCGIHFF